MTFTVQHNRQNWRNPIITTDWQWIIRAAWGRRRVSSRAAKITQAYPESLTATFGMWVDWYRRNRQMRFDYVVVSGDGADHGAEYVALLERRASEALQAEKLAAVQANLGDLNARRAKARAEKNFALADELRSQIEAVGIVVTDEKLEPKP